MISNIPRDVSRLETKNGEDIYIKKLKNGEGVYIKAGDKL